MPSCCSASAEMYRPPSPSSRANSLVEAIMIGSFCVFVCAGLVASNFRFLRRFDKLYFPPLPPAFGRPEDTAPGILDEWKVLVEVTGLRGDAPTLRVSVNVSGRRIRADLAPDPNYFPPNEEVYLQWSHGEDGAANARRSPYVGTVTDVPSGALVGVAVGIFRDDHVFHGKMTTANTSYYIEPASKYCSGGADDVDPRCKEIFNAILFMDADMAFSEALRRECTVDDAAWCDDALTDLQPKRNESDETDVELEELHPYLVAANGPRSCPLEVIADHTMLRLFGGREDALVTKLSEFVVDASEIVRKTDFNEDGLWDNVRLSAARVVVLNDTAAEATLDGVASLFVAKQVRNVRDIPSAWLRFRGMQRRRELYCATILFVNRDFEANSSFAATYVKRPGELRGGICARPNPATEETAHTVYNGAFISVRHRSSALPDRAVVLALVHVVGHLFGAEHDNRADADCVADDATAKGDYMMSAVHVDGSMENHVRFSPCSKKRIARVLYDGSASWCLEDERMVTCGNGYQEPWEDCDCGWAVLVTALDERRPTCNVFVAPCCVYNYTASDDFDASWRSAVDAACIADNVLAGNERPRRLQPTQCEQGRGGCCSHTRCTLLPFGHRCGSGRQGVFVPCDSGRCDGISTECNRKLEGTDGTNCMPLGRTCARQGTCTSDICRDFGVRQCRCSEEGNDQCEVCCTTLDGEECKPASAFGYFFVEGGKALKPRGTVCRPSRGNRSSQLLCDERGKCIGFPRTSAINKQAPDSSISGRVAPTLSSLTTTPVAEGRLSDDDNAHRDGAQKTGEILHNCRHCLLKFALFIRLILSMRPPVF